MKKYSLNHSVVQQHEQISTYVKPTIEEKPDSVILHRGTNDLRSDDESNRIIRDIVNVATECKQTGCDVTISALLHIEINWTLKLKL